MAAPDPKVHLKTSYYSVGEGDGSVEVCAQVTTNQFQNEVRVGYFTTFGSATGKKPCTINYKHLHSSIAEMLALTVYYTVFPFQTQMIFLVLLVPCHSRGMSLSPV